MEILSLELSLPSKCIKMQKAKVRNGSKIKITVFDTCKVTKYAKR